MCNIYYLKLKRIRTTSKETYPHDIDMFPTLDCSERKSNPNIIIASTFDFKWLRKYLTNLHVFKPNCFMDKFSALICTSLA